MQTVVDIVIKIAVNVAAAESGSAYHNEIGRLTHTTRRTPSDRCLEAGSARRR